MKLKKVFSGILSFVMMTTAITTPLGDNIGDLIDKFRLSASAETSSDSSSDNFKYETISYTYEGVEDKKQYFQFMYSDGIFLSDANEDSPDMAKVSVSLAMAAYEEGSIKDCLDGMKFTDQTFYNYDVTSTYEDNDRVAFSIASKKIGDYTVYVVPIRGTHGNCEWFSNFNLGTGEDHAGFYKAAAEVEYELCTKIAADIPKNNGEIVYDKSKTIIMITGHSRGAAVANIVAGKLSTTNGRNSYALPEHIFGYTYACPAVSKNADTNLNNIRNYINPGDVIPALPLEEWGFRRYGKVCELDETNDDVFNNFNQRFKSVTGEEYKGLLANDSWVNSLKILADSQESYNSDSNQFIFKALASLLACENSEETFGELLLKCGAEYAISPSFIKIVLFTNIWRMEKSYSATSTTVALTFDDDCKELNSLLFDIDQAQGKIAGMNSDEFNSWLNSNGSLLGRIKSQTDIDVKSRSDLSKARSEVADQMKLIAKWAPNIETLFNLIYQSGRKILDCVVHAHTGETYVLWINTMYFGCNGWANNQDIQSMTIPNEINRIDDSCFYNCQSLTELTIPDTVTQLEQKAFYGCAKLTKVTMPADIKYVTNGGNSTFIGCNIQELRYTVGRTKEMTDFINGGDNNNYYYSLPYIARESLKTVTFDEGITHLGNNGFKGCSALTNVKLPSTIVDIGDYAFAGCTVLKGITFPVGLKQLGNGSFSNSGLLTINFNKNVTEVPDNCFSYCKSLTKLTIPNTINKLGKSAFAYCTSIKELTISDQVRKLDGYAFCGCTGLTKVTMPVDIEYANYYNACPAFCNCNNVQEIRYTIGQTKEMTDFINGGDNNYYYYSLPYIARESLKTVTFDEGITHLGNNGFKGCSALTNVKLPSTIVDIGDYTFANCTGISDVYYASNKDNWGKVKIGDYNTDLTKAKMHYDSPIPIELSDCTIELSSNKMMYTGNALKPKVTIKNGSKTLVLNTDYAIRYSNNIDVGTASVIISGRGKYIGKITKTFEIVEKTYDLSDCTITLNKTMFKSTGNAIKPSVTVKNGSAVLTAGTDYIVRYVNNINPGKASVIIAGKGKYTGRITKTFTILDSNAKDISECTIKLNKTTFNYTGKGVKPKVTVTDGDTVLQPTVDYNVKYVNNIEAGTATVVISGTGKYQGKVNKTFTIVK